MLRHEFSMEMPHSPARIWALLHDYERWTEWSEMVERVDVLWPGDEDHNGRLRRVFYKLPDGRTGSSLELVTEAVRDRAHTYTMISRDGNDHVGHVRLERLGPDRTRLHFDEEADMDPEVYGFINRHNEAHMRAASEYLSAHPEYRPDLVERGG
ncbi:MAG TPA: SRPBCC family protein [Acidimicrobiales bacterium]|nr:SRPBCC family protein [Acidimicrobiales bacterium]